MRRGELALAMAAAVSVGLGAVQAQADDLYWGPNTAEFEGRTIPMGGDGVWDLTNPVWAVVEDPGDTPLHGSSYVPWTNGSSIAWFPLFAQTAHDIGTPEDPNVIGASAGTVTLGDAIVAGGLRNLRTGYLITDGGDAANTLTLVGSPDPGDPGLTLPPRVLTVAGGSPEIQAPLIGTDGVTLWTSNRSGNVTLSGDISGLSGPITVITETLTISHDNVLGANDNSVDNRISLPSASGDVEGSGSGGRRLALSGGIELNRYVHVLGASRLQSVSGDNTLLGTAFFSASGVAHIDISEGSKLTIEGEIDSSSGKNIQMNGPGTLVINSVNSAQTVWQLQGGTTILNGTRGTGNTARVYRVNDGATLGGTGTVYMSGAASTPGFNTGSLAIDSGGTFAPGDPDANDGIGTFTVNGHLFLAPGSALDFDLSSETTIGDGVNDLIEVFPQGSFNTGSVTLDGTLNINAVDGTLAGTETDPAVYTLIRYHGSNAVLTDNGLQIGSVPNGFSVSDFTLDTSTAGFVNLIVSPDVFLLPGDANRDGVVNITDLSILAGNWQQTGMTWDDGDFNGDGVVNVSDLSILAGNWQATTLGGSSSMSFDEALAMFDAFSGVVVPEPGALGLLGMSGLMLFGRRRRSR